MNPSPHARMELRRLLAEGKVIEHVYTEPNPVREFVARWWWAPLALALVFLFWWAR